MDQHQISHPAAAQASGERLGAGKIHVLGLGPLKERLGPKWDRMSAHVQRFFDAAVKRHLRPGDSFIHAGELSYVLTFPGLSLAESQLVCAAIAEEVCGRLFGESDEHVALRNLVAEMDGSELVSGSTEFLDTYLEQKGVETIVASSPGRIENVLAPPAAGSKPGNGKITSQARGHYVYRPVWDVTNQAVLTYLCQPELPKSKNLSSNATKFSRPEVSLEDANFWIDVNTLKECSNRISELHRAGLKVLLGVPVHFGTISYSRSWSEYASVYRHIAPEVASNLAFFVEGIEGGVPHIRLAQELPKLSKGGHRVFCSLTNLESAAAQFANTSVHAIGLSLDTSPMIETRLVADMKLLARSARTAGLNTYILGVSSTSLALYAIEAGMRYLEGPSIRPAVTDPRHAFVHGIEDLYLPRFAARNGQSSTV